MSGSFGSSETPADRPYREETTGSDSAARASESAPIDRAALEQALQETLTSASSGAPLDPAEKQAILAAAQRHRSEEITLDIAADLIQAVLVTHFRSLQKGDSFWQTVARDIARTLLADPQAEARLNTLWQRLRKESA